MFNSVSEEIEPNNNDNNDNNNTEGISGELEDEETPLAKLIMIQEEVPEETQRNVKEDEDPLFGTIRFVYPPSLTEDNRHYTLLGSIQAFINFSQHFTTLSKKNSNQQKKIKHILEDSFYVFSWYRVKLVVVSSGGIRLIVGSPITVGDAIAKERARRLLNAIAFFNGPFSHIQSWCNGNETTQGQQRQLDEMTRIGWEARNYMMYINRHPILSRYNYLTYAHIPRIAQQLFISSAQLIEELTNKYKVLGGCVLLRNEGVLCCSMPPHLIEFIMFRTFCRKSMSDGSFQDLIHNFDEDQGIITDRITCKTSAEGRDMGNTSWEGGSTATRSSATNIMDNVGLSAEDFFSISAFRRDHIENHDFLIVFIDQQFMESMENKSEMNSRSRLSLQIPKTLLDDHPEGRYVGLFIYYTKYFTVALFLPLEKFFNNRFIKELRVFLKPSVQRLEDQLTADRSIKEQINTHEFHNGNNCNTLVLNGITRDAKGRRAAYDRHENILDDFNVIHSSLKEHPSLQSLSLANANGQVHGRRVEESEFMIHEPNWNRSGEHPEKRLKDALFEDFKISLI